MLPRCVAFDRSEVRQRLDLEREARRQRLLGLTTQSDPHAAALLPSRFSLSEPPPAASSRQSMEEWTQWGLADAKLSLFSSEASLRSKYGTGAYACRRGALQAMDCVRTLAAPPILSGQAHRLDGSWCLVETTRPERFGTRSMSEISRGLENFYDRSAMHVDVHFIVRTLTREKQYSETTFFADTVGGTQGAFTEYGDIEVGYANTVTLVPARACLTIGRHETDMELGTHVMRAVVIGYLDDDLMLEGTYATDVADVLAWGRDHGAAFRGM